MGIKKTSLNKLHQDYKAKFVEFAGYEMPIQYTKGIIEEHKFTRTNAGIFDVSHMGQLFIYGEKDLTIELEKIFPLDLKNLKNNCSKYSFLMNDDAVIILNAACKDKDYEILSKLLKNKFKIKLDNERSLIAIQGPRSAEILKLVIPEVNKLKFMTGGWFDYQSEEIFITRSGYTGEDGFEISIINDLVEKFTQNLINNGAELIGLGARDTLRLEAGLCLYGQELNLNKTPIEANLKWAISKERLSNGGFLGSDKIKKQIQAGPKKLRVGIKPDGRLIAREKSKIFNESNLPIGEITSGTFGPSVNGPIAMGYIDKEFSKTNTKVLVEVRGKKYPANICGLPFYKKNHIKGASYE
jgi:aminomethyltransferase